MTINEALTKLDALKPNNYTDAEKIGWLDHIERVLYTEIFSKHEDDPTIVIEPGDDGEEIETKGFNGYDDDTDLDTELLVPDTYADLYVHYLMSQVDYYNAEFDRYSNTSTMFNVSYQNFANYWMREHRVLATTPLVLF